MGKLVIFSAPSGSGKTTIVRELLKRFPQFEFSISATSRQLDNHLSFGDLAPHNRYSQLNALEKSDKFVFNLKKNRTK